MKRFLALVLSLIMVFSLLPSTGFAAPQDNVPSGMTLVKSTEYRITPGISEENAALLNSVNQQNLVYTLTIDPSVSTVGFLAGYADYNTSGKWKMQTVRDQAAAAEKATGKKIVAAINGDYFNMQTGEPLGALVMNGQIVHGVGTDVGYFAVLKDGTAVCRDSSVPLTDVKEAVGSPIWLVRNGQNVTDQNNPDVMPRCAVGVKADGKVVLLVNDGRQAPKSVGMTLYETAEYMRTQGCVDSLYLDGGGSATFTTVREGTSSLEVQNLPSDGVERQVSSSLFVYSTATSDGSCDHVSISPKGEVYTPGSTVQFKAIGVDAVGGKAELPSDGHFELADESFGAITADGLFTSSGKTGTVTVKYVSASLGNNTGSIEIQTPDLISFVNDEISLDFEESTTLGLTVKYKNQDINYNDNDFNWSVSNILDANKQPIEGKTLGTFAGNTFTSSDGTTLYGTITCTSKYDENVKGSIQAIVGLQPTVVMDFEDLKNENGETVQSAKDYWTFSKAVFLASGGQIHALWEDGSDSEWAGNLLWSVNYGTEMPVVSRILHGGYYDGDPTTGSRGGKEKLSVVSIASGEPVRKGNYSLKMSYDFSKWVTGISATEGACIGFSEATQEIPGTPTALGIYVYCPEGTPNLWLRCRVKDGQGTVQTVNFTDSTPGNALGSWTGWRYLEADLSGFSAPFSLIGGETIRLMRLSGYGNTLGDGSTIPDSQCKGDLYFDNLQFVYGANTADVDNPNINEIKANNVALAEDGSTVVNSNTVSFDISVSDVQNKYTSGINYDTVNIILDGNNITEAEAGNIAIDPSKDMVALYDQYLADGEHSIQVTVRDNEDNDTTFTREFTVLGDDSTGGGSVIVTPPIAVKGAESVFVGSKASLDVTSGNLANTEKITAKVKISGIDVDKDSFTVTYGEGYEEAAAPVYNKDKTYTISAKKTEGAELSGAGTVATINVAVPKTATDADYFGYAVTQGIAEFTDCEKASATFTARTKKAAIVAKYVITNDVIQAGEDAVFTVKDNDGKAVKGISIYNAADDQFLGTTDKRGRFTTSLLREVGYVSIYAQDDEGMSFIKRVHSFITGANEDGTPAFISINASANSETEKNITWISNPDVNEPKAIAKVALKSDYDAQGEAAFVEYSGVADDLTFDGSTNVTDNRYVYSNKVTVDGLKRGNEYVYRVGDGNIWSDINSFSTAYKGVDTKFFLIGDTQAEDMTKITNIANKLAEEGGYSFGVQTGDFTETASIYSYWNNIMGAFDEDYFKTVDMIHVTGNHELYGDAQGVVSKNLFNIESLKHYSVEYGNVYVAVLGYDSTEDGAKANAEWLVKDAAASNAIWKIVVSHQPPYGTNVTTDDSANFTKYVAPACDEAGIDFMFSGHDHSFAQTFPLNNGEKVGSNEGTVYYIIGSTGEKSYGVTKGAAHKIATQDFDGLYFTVEAGEKEITIRALDNCGETLVDTYTKTKTGCKVHDYLVTDDGMLICDTCSHAEPIGNYTGLVKDENTGKTKYLNDGELAKDCWVNIGNDAYCFDEEGNAYTGKCKIDINTKDFYGNEYVIEDAEYTFAEDGKFVKGAFIDEVVVDKDGSSKTITRYYTAGGVYAVHWYDIDGDTYYFKKTSNQTTYDSGMMYTGDGVTPKAVKTVANNNNRFYVFGADGKLVRGAFSGDDQGNVRYYWGDEYVTGDKKIGGVKYHFNETTGYLDPVLKLEECIVKYTESYEYTGASIRPTVSVKYKGVELVNGQDYTVSYKNNKAVGTATITITPVVKTIRTDVTGNITGFTGTVTKTFKIVPKRVQGLTVTAASMTSAQLKWTKQTGIDGYRIYRATSKDGEYELIKLITDASVTSYTNKGLTTGTTYYYKVRPYKTVSDKLYVSFSGSVVSVKPIPPETSFTAKSASYKSVKLTWTALPGVDGYKIYRATSSDGEYILVKVINNANTTSYTNTKLKTGQAYYYKVKAYVDTDSTRVSGDSVSKKAVPALDVPEITSLKNTSKAAVTIKWNGVAGADGYRIYRANTKTGEYTLIKIIDSGDAKSYINGTKLTAGNTYYYKVRAFVKIDGKNVMSDYSAVKSVKVTK